MTAQREVTIKAAAGAPMSLFERWLTLWVFLCIVAGILLGQLLPAPFQALGRMEVAQVNIPVGLLIWVMIIPMLVKVDFGALHEVRRHVRGIGVTLFVNWLVKPFSMAFLGWLFIRQLFAPYLPAEQIDFYIAGLILLAAAPCTAMVFVWSRLSNGDPLFTLSQVAVNDTIMVFAFAPIVGLLLGISAITVPWDTLVTSVVLVPFRPWQLAQNSATRWPVRSNCVRRTSSLCAASSRACAEVEEGAAWASPTGAPKPMLAAAATCRKMVVILLIVNARWVERLPFYTRSISGRHWQDVKSDRSEPAPPGKSHQARSYHCLLALTTFTTSSITGTSMSTPTTVASTAPDSKPNREIAAATASSKKLEAPISAEGQAMLCCSPTMRLSQ